MPFYTPGGAPQVSDASATSLLFLRTFEGSVVPTETFTQTGTGMTSTLSGGFYVINNGNDITGADIIQLVSRRTFPLFATDATVAEFWLSTTGDAQDSYASWGLMTPAATSQPAVDGIYFRLVAGASFNGVFTSDNAPQLQGVLSVGGTETIVSLAKGAANIPGAGVHRYRIEVRHNTVIFSIDERAAGSIDTSALVLPSMTCCQPVGFQIANGSPASARTISLGLVAVYARHLQPQRPWGHAMAGNGFGAYQNPPGGATGMTASYANSAVVAAFTPANNAAGAINALGGQYQINATATAETDLVVFSYVNPGSSATVAGRTLYVTGIRIGEMVVQGAAVATLTTIQWGCSVGSAGSLGTADSVTAFSHRRLALGMQTLPVGAVVGQMTAGLPWTDLSPAPMVVPQVARFNIFIKVINGAATGSLVFRGTVTVNGYFE